MNGVAGRIIDITLTGILLAWVLTHSKAFGQVTSSSASAITGGVQALWGRGLAVHD